MRYPILLFLLLITLHCGYGQALSKRDKTIADTVQRYFSKLNVKQTPFTLTVLKIEIISGNELDSAITAYWSTKMVDARRECQYDSDKIRTALDRLNTDRNTLKSDNMNTDQKKLDDVKYRIKNDSAKLRNVTISASIIKHRKDYEHVQKTRDSLKVALVANNHSHNINFKALTKIQTHNNLVLLNVYLDSRLNVLAWGNKLPIYEKE